MQDPCLKIYKVLTLSDCMHTILALIAIISALGPVGVIAVDTIEIVQDAEARGCSNGIAVNASQGRCIH